MGARPKEEGGSNKGYLNIPQISLKVGLYMIRWDFLVDAHPMMVTQCKWKRLSIKPDIPGRRYTENVTKCGRD